jgi:RNA polymerase sigma-70 factor (ECF subfamily)
MRATAEATPTELEERFAAFVSAQRPRALRLAWRLVGAQDAAEDVMQDALLKAYRGLHRFRGEASLETWFYRILVRQAHSYARWRLVRERWGGLWVADELPDPTPRAQRDAGLRRHIAEAMERLPRTQRDAFVLVHLEGFTVTEAATVMGKAPGTVKSHLHRALTSLRSRLEGLL